MHTSTNQFVGLAHRSLYMDSPEILPSLLQEGDQEVETHDNVLSDFFLSHLLISDGNSHTCDLLKLELNGGSQIIDLSLQVFVMSNDLREHADFVEGWS